MSDGAVGSLISEMEKYLKETELPDIDFIVSWNEKFHAAVDAAERGTGWQDIVDRAHVLGEEIQKRIGGLNYEREQVRREMEIQSLGKRALKGYSSGIQ